MSDLDNLESLVGDIGTDLNRTRAELAALTKVVEDLIAWKIERSKPIVIEYSDSFASTALGRWSTDATIVLNPDPNDPPK